MFFTTKRLTKKQLRDKICSFARQIGVSKVIFNNRARKVCGTFNASNNIIFISLNQTKRETLNTFFHELGHFRATQQKKWIKYHFNLYKKFNFEILFRVENKIEKLGKEMWNKHVNKKQWGNYKYFYLKSKKKQLINTLQTGK